MIEVLLVIGLFVAMYMIVDRAEKFESSSQWSKTWEKTLKRHKI